MNESRVKSCLAKFDNGSYSRLQFLRAVSHSIDAHTAVLQPADSDNDDDDDGGDRSYTNYDVHGATHCGRCEVCFVAPREGFTLVPCGHARFCESCASREPRYCYGHVSTVP